MTPEQLQAWLQVAIILTGSGTLAVNKVIQMIRREHATMTEEEMNTILEAVENDAKARKALADGDAGKPDGPSA